ncbi:MAG: virulence factor MviN, partial [Streptosporangiaceae bacterium]
AGPVARVFILGGPGAADPAQLARALVAFAPGLVGFGLVAHLGRALYAVGQGRWAAGSTVAGWAGVAAADILLVRLAPGDWVVAALGLGNTLGMTLAGALLIASMARARGRRALGGVVRAVVAGVLGGLCGYAAGAGVSMAIGPVALWGSVGSAAATGLAALTAFAVVAFALDRHDLWAVVRRRASDG